MDAQKAVEGIKGNMVRYMHSGQATKFRGIVVAPDVYEALKQESEKFQDIIGVTGTEGHRSLRYQFYILPNPNFPHRVSGTPYFFVPHPKEPYIASYLGKEEEILGRDKHRVIELAGLKVEEINPIIGCFKMGDSWNSRSYYEVVFEDVIALAEEVKARFVSAASEARKNRQGKKKPWSFSETNAHLELSYAVRKAIDERFDRDCLVNNPPEVQGWVDKPEEYLYTAALRTDPTLRQSIGRILMYEDRTEKTFQILGIAVDGRGELHKVVLPGSKQTELQLFAEFAARHFLPEEIVAFCASVGAPELVRLMLGANFWKDRVPQEWWGDWTDYEELGRIQESTSTHHGHLLRVTFVNSRAKSFDEYIVVSDDNEGWPAIRDAYFPPGWQGWPETKQMSRLSAIARSL